MDPNSTPKMLASSTNGHAGHTLGGASGDATSASKSPPLTAEQLRQKRLEKLHKPVTPQVTVKPAVQPQQQQQQQQQQFQPIINNNNYDDDEEDAELQRALAMSLEDANVNVPVDTATPTTTTTSNTTSSTVNGEMDQDVFLSQGNEDLSRYPTDEDDNNMQMNMDMDMESHDAQLAAAIKLSMEMAMQHPPSTSLSSSSTLSQTQPPPPPSSDNLPPFIPLNPRTTRSWSYSKEPTNILDIHAILWDNGITTKNDQLRWLKQGILFKHSQLLQQPPSQHPDLLLSIIDNANHWGLTQSHGGPCGVLASIQAEIMRLLLFASDHSTLPTGTQNEYQSSNNNHTNTMEQSLSWIQMYSNQLQKHASSSSSSSNSESSTSSSNTFISNTRLRQKPHPDFLTPICLQATLAFSMGIILARAALQPSAIWNDPTVATTTTSSTANTSTTASGPASHSSTQSPNIPVGPAIVRLVLPKPPPTPTSTSTTPFSSDNANNNSDLVPSQLEWYHLEPWSNDIGGSGESDHLFTYTISLPPEHSNVYNTGHANNHNDNNTDDDDDDNDDPMDTTSTSMNDSLAQTKRQKRHSISSSDATLQHDANTQQQQQQQQQLNPTILEWKLARAVAEFLLETNSLHWFHKDGGVLLFVLSLAASRTPPNIQGDMDDPTARLTGQFGHCSQELINLLLTGQAVSNVFDNTLRPSGELICRGIQKQPAIGYLSQLESMRYLEVGGYYKTPQYPIWVVGSTSHFTILFGDADCLQESESDRLLEKVRRAFKQMDGGEENGFIQMHQLGDFLNILGLSEKIGPHGVQTLGATVEVAGAGIILWEDLWKRVSRLMTGASLESVLEWEDDPMAPTPIATTTPNPPDPALAQAGISDEELARMLQTEWNGGILPTPLPPATATTTSAVSNTAAAPTTKTETFGKTFQLYHYNGLRGGSMKPFRVTRLSADEAIGASVSLGGPSSSSTMAHHMGQSSEGLEDVLRTKWPSCKINWLGGSVPSID